MAISSGILLIMFFMPRRLPVHYAAVTWIALATSIVAFFCYRFYIRSTQLRLNQEASVSMAGDEAFALYLRPFTSARKHLVPNSMPERSDRLLIGAWWDIEFAITLAMDGAMPLVAVGDKHRSFGASKVLTTDSAWKQLAVDLMRRARVIVLLPSQQPGTAWEIEQILRTPDLRTKTVFLMPPSTWRLKRILAPWQWLRERRSWEQTRDHFKRSGLVALPEYNASGAIFVVGPDGNPSILWPSGDYSHAYIGRLLSAVAEAGQIEQTPEAREKQLQELSFGFTPRNHAMESVFSVLWAFIAFATIRAIAYEPFHVPSSHMSPTLIIGDYFFASKGAYGCSRFTYSGVDLGFEGRILEALPERGDVVVFYPPKDNLTHHVHRVIGLPGDEIELRGGTLVVNGTDIPRVRSGSFNIVDYGGVPIEGAVYTETLPNGKSYSVLDTESGGFLDDVGPYTVPAGHYFMLGDNRDNSSDSRLAWAIGYVPLERIVGRVEILHFSAAVNEPSAWRWTSPWTWSFDVRWQRIFSRVH